MTTKITPSTHYSRQTRKYWLVSKNVNFVQVYTVRFFHQYSFSGQYWQANNYLHVMADKIKSQYLNSILFCLKTNKIKTLKTTINCLNCKNSVWKMHEQLHFQNRRY